MNITAPNYHSPIQNTTQNCIQHRAITMKGIDKVEITQKNINEKPTKMLFALLSNSLNGKPIDKSVFEGATQRDWEILFNISRDSSVTGMALDGAKNLPQETIPKEIGLRMLRMQRESKERHAIQEKVLGELSEMYAKEGIETIQMKGIGFSMNYPEPTRRFGGDLDIFTRIKGIPSIERSSTSDRVDEIMRKLGCEVSSHSKKHTEFEYKGIKVENHCFFLNKDIMNNAKPLDDFLHKSLNPRTQILPNGTKILVPSKEFNSIFIAHHAWQHYAFTGIDIHHLTDWAMQLKNGGLHIPEEAKGTQFEKFTYALTNLSNKYLGTNVKVPENEQLENDILNKMLHPEPEKIEKRGTIDTLIYKTKRFFKKAQRSRDLCGQSIGVAIYKSIKYHIKHPETILGKL